MSILEQQTHLERTRPQRVDALMWIAQHAGILADGYVVTATDTHDDRPGATSYSIGQVTVQGEAGSLRSLVTRLDAVRAADRENRYVEWVAYDDGVLIRLVEEPA